MQNDLSAFDANGFTVNAIGADPAVDVAAIVADLKAPVVDRFDEVEAIASADFDEDDIVRVQRGGITGSEGDEIAIVDFPTHGVSARADLDGFAFLESFDCEFCPAHDHRLSGEDTAQSRMKASARSLRRIAKNRNTG